MVIKAKVVELGNGKNGKPRVVLLPEGQKKKVEFEMSEEECRQFWDKLYSVVDIEINI